MCAALKSPRLPRSFSFVALTGAFGDAVVGATSASSSAGFLELLLPSPPLLFEEEESPEEEYPSGGSFIGFSDEEGGSGTGSVGIDGRPFGFAAGFGGPDGSPSTFAPFFESSVGNGKAAAGGFSCVSLVPEGVAESVTHAGSFDPVLHFFEGFEICAPEHAKASSRHAATASLFADLVRSLITCLQD